MRTINRLAIKINIILSILFISGLIGVSTCSALEISVNESSEIKGDTIFLGDIAEFTPFDDSRVSRLSEIKISVAPAPNTFRRLNRELIFHKLSSFTRKNEDITIIVPKSLTVHRDAQIIYRETIESIFTDYVLNNSSWEPDNVIIEKVNAPQSIALPEGKLSWDINERRNNNFLGNTSLNIEFAVNGASIRKIIVSGKISITRDVLRAARNIDSGEIISADDLMLVSENTIRLSKGLLISPKKIIGKRATRRIMADQKVKLGMFEVPPLIEKGDRVIIKAENNEIRITVSGEALEKGCSGDKIRVRNIRSGQEVIATVRNSDIVEVYF